VTSTAMSTNLVSLLSGVTDLRDMATF
jgi:hypothetical protein